jgi:hypothetical protein
LEYNSTLAGKKHTLAIFAKLELFFCLNCLGSFEFEDSDVGAAANKFGEDAACVVSSAHQILQLGRPKLHDWLVGWACIQRHPPQAQTAPV